MADAKKPNETPAGEKKTGEQHGGKFHYNPVNMSEKDAGIKEHDEQASKEHSRDDVDSGKPVKKTLP